MSVDGEEVVEKFSLALNELWGGNCVVLAASQVCVVYGLVGGSRSRPLRRAFHIVGKLYALPAMRKSST